MPSPFDDMKFNFIREWLKATRKVNVEESIQCEIETIAYLLCCGLNNKEIYSSLSMAKATFSERKKTAIEQGLFVPLYRGKRESEINRVILNADIQRIINETLGDGRFCAVYVYPSSEKNPEDSMAWDDALAMYAKFAGPRLVDLVRGVNVLGCTWGRTVYSVTERFIDAWPRRKRQETLVIPTWGEPLKLGEHASEVYKKPISSTEMSVRMQEVMNRGKQSHPVTPSLLGIPAIIPITYSDEEADTIKKLMSTADGYSSIFGRGNHPSEAHIDKMDGLLTAAGAPEPKERFWSEAVLKSGDFSDDERNLLFDGVIGDIGGVLLPRRNASSKQTELLDRIRNRWLGITEQQIVNCANRARTDGPPGVILCAVGETRAETVFECVVEKKMVNHLLVDFHLASKLIEILEERIRHSDV